MTVSIENFIKAIYKLNKQAEVDAKLSTIAGVLGISNAAATDMARKLAVKNLVHYTKYKPLELTEEGNKLALNVIRKHRLWESFLYQTLGLSLHEIHTEAEHLEHLTSDFLADKIEKYLDYPAFDPHGDPIPNLQGKVENDGEQLLLAEALPGQMYEVSRLFSSEKDFFDFCASNELKVGSQLWIEKQYGTTGMTEVRMDENKLLLNQDFTRVIYVKQKAKA